MLEQVDLSRSMSKAEFKPLARDLGFRLAELQRHCHDAKVPTVLAFEGWDAAGKGYIINRLTSILDPRGFWVHPIGPPTPEEARLPWMARFWRRLPERGSIGIFDRSWYGRVLVERVDGLVPERVWRAAYEEIDAFERQLTDDGYVVLKFWLHIDKAEQKRRFARLLADPDMAWKVGKGELRRRKQWAAYLAAVEEMLERTSTGFAPWTVVEANCLRFGLVKVFETIIDAQCRAIERAEAIKAQPAKEKAVVVPVKASVAARSNPLDHVDLSLKLDRVEYSAQLKELQRLLVRLEHRMYLAQVPAVVVYEGWDAAGKGGNIKRLTEGMDPRGYGVVPIGAPTQQELANHYLWRFWTRLPKAGHLTVFDRSWYGRVMVERIEGFCTEERWRAAYQEINEFEAQLAAAGTVIVKFWLHMSPEEQLRRFQERENTPYKAWKLTPEDWRNREKWPQYYEAVGEMIQRTSTTYAPWTIIEGDCKLWARVKALRVVADAIQVGLAARG